jgi:hypothetical protein
MTLSCNLTRDFHQINFIALQHPIRSLNRSQVQRYGFVCDIFTGLAPGVIIVSHLRCFAVVKKITVGFKKDLPSSAGHGSVT